MMAPLSRPLLAAAVAAGLGGCAILRPFTHTVQIRPVSTQAMSAHREDGYYASAKTAIGQRDYARALELLQAARAVNPDDARVLNAFGVVYDKLNRFDLSARYYAEASALDPGSPILANNMAWSAALLARSSAAPPDAGAVQQGRLALSAPEPVPAIEAVGPARPAVLRLGFPAPPPPAQPVQRRGVAVENASGRRDGATPVVEGLMRLGWTPRIETGDAARTPTSTITYPSHQAVVAKALARTLATRVQLVDCGGGCDSVRLILGADSARWSFARTDWKGRSQ